MSVAERVTERVAAIIEPVIQELGFELVDVDFLTDRGRRVLRIYVDTREGITLDECAEVSREVGSLIDLEDLISEQYVLEVSSPGLNRPLRKEKDFIAAMGRKVKVKMRKPLEGRRNFTGMLENFDNGVITLRMENNEIVLPVAEIERANIVYQF